MLGLILLKRPNSSHFRYRRGLLSVCDAQLVVHIIGLAEVNSLLTISSLLYMQ